MRRQTDSNRMRYRCAVVGTVVALLTLAISSCSEDSPVGPGGDPGPQSTCSYALLDPQWPRASGTNEVVMTFATEFPSKWWQVAQCAMSEWHWRSGADIAFKYRTQAVKLTMQRDNYNAILFRPLNGSLGLAYAWSVHGVITEVDVVINSDIAWGTAGERDRYDLQSTMAHEFGHVWRLADLHDSSAYQETMYESLSKGDTQKRTLFCGDKQGVQFTYGGKH